MSSEAYVPPARMLLWGAELFGPCSFHNGGFYVVRTMQSAWTYLHSDGRWRDGTYHDGEFTGWFDSREDAMAAIDAACKLGNWPLK